MDKINCGGPAFARSGSDYSDSQAGMSLRDWFAGQALAGIANDNMQSYEAVAFYAYKFADAMLAERIKEKSDDLGAS